MQNSRLWCHAPFGIDHAQCCQPASLTSCLASAIRSQYHRAETVGSIQRSLTQRRRLPQQQLEAHLWGAANILRGKTAGQDYKNYILSLMFYKRLCDQWEHEADEAIAELEVQQGKTFTDAQRAVFRARGEHRFSIP